jgi:signal transduction histidine kinase
VSVEGEAPARRRRSFVRTLYSKLALALTALVAALLVAQLFVTMRVSQVYEEEATQRLYRDLAGNLLTQQVDPKWGVPVLEGAFEMLMHLNPLMEIYWVAPDGRLLVYADPHGHVVLDRVDTAPIEAFVSGKQMFPIHGDDPRHQTRRAIFSAAEVREKGALSAYLYVVLQGESTQSFGDMVSGSRISQLAVGSLALMSVFGLVVGLVLFRSITRRVTDLDREMAHFLADVDAGEPALDPPSDELDRLRSTFDHLAARVSQQVNTLEEVDRLRRELVASVSHDLRTPLAALRGYLETLQMMGDQLDPPERRRYIEAASRHTDRLASLVDSLFELAKLESGVVQPRRESFQLEELAQDVLQPYVLRAKDAGVALDSDLAAGLPAVHADIGLVERVLENLIENALRHTPSGGSVELRVHAADGEVEASVSDTGSGIPPEALPHIFERFYRAPTGETTEGMGLGLAIVRRILELHDREIDVESTPGAGSRFTFRLGAD